MNRAFFVYLLLQAAFATGRNISISIGGAQESPASVTYVDGKAPEDLKAGPAKNSTKSGEGIVQAAFIRSSSRDIPKDDEIENEEFERFIKKHHNRPTIETVFVSSSPSPLYDQESEEFNEESSSLRSQAEFFKQPAKNQTFERSVALPALDHGYGHGHGHGHINLVGGGISYGGGDGIIVQGDGGQYSTFINGQYLPSYQDLYAGGEQQFYQVSQPIPSGVPAVVAIPSPVPRTINVAQHGLKTKTFEIRRPAIQKHYYDIEERVIIRPAGSIVLELNRPVAKIPTGERIIPFGGLQGGFAGFQQSQGAIGLQGGIAGIALQQSQGGFDLSQGGFQGGNAGVGVQQTQGGIGVSQGGLQGGITGIGIQQSQGGVVSSTTPIYTIEGTGIGIQQSQQGIGTSQGGIFGVRIQQSQGGAVPSTTPSFGIGRPQGGVGGVDFQQSQQGIGVSQGGTSGVGIQQSQGGVVPSTTPSFGIGGPQGGVGGVDFQQSQQGIGVSQGGTSGVGIQQSQGGVVPSTIPSFGIGGPQGRTGGVDFQQTQQGIGVSQGGTSGVGIQQSQGRVVPSTTPSFGIGGPQGGFGGVDFQQSQQGIGVSQGGSSGLGIQQSQGGVVPSTTPSFGIGGPQGGAGGVGFQQSQQGIGVSQGGTSGVGIQQSQGGVVSSTTSSIGIGGPQGGFGGVDFQQSQQGVGVSQGGTSGVGIQQSQGGVVSSTTSSIGIGGPQGGFGGVGIQQSQGGIVSSTTPSIPIGGPQGGLIGTAYQQTPGGAIYSTTLTSYNPSGSPSISIFRGSQGGTGIQSQGGVSYTTTFATPTPSIGIGGGGVLGSGFQQSQGAIGISQGGVQGGAAGVGIQQSQGGIISSTTAGPYLPPALPTPTVAIGGGFQQSQGGINYPTTFAPQASSVGIGGVSGVGFQQSQGAIGVSQSGPQGAFAGVGIQQSQGGVVSSTTPAPYLPPVPGYTTYPLPRPTIVPRPQQPYPSVSTTTASSIAAGVSNDDSVVVEASSNVRNRGTYSATTTTERSFTSTVDQNASAYARAGGSSSRSVQAVSKNITPFMIAVGEPDFHYPPYVEINSNGSPLGHLQLVPATSQTYPRMRYQGQLLTGEVRTDDAQQSGYGALSQQNIYESQAQIAEIPPNTPYDEQSLRNAQSSFTYQQPGKVHSNTQFQYVGSTKQPLQVSQISSGAHQQPAQVYRHHFIKTTSQPITIAEVAQQQQYQANQQYVAQQPIQVAKYSQQPAQVYQISQQPVHDTQLHQQQAAQYRSSVPQRTNLVAQIRHQQQQKDAQIQQQQHAAQVNQQQQDELNRSSIPQEHVVEVTQQPIDVRSSTPNFQYQHQAVSTTLQPETFASGRRLYQQSSVPLKYTQHHTINVAPSQHSIFFSNHSQQPENPGRSQNLEIPPEPEVNVKETSVRSTNIESTTAEAVTSSTTSRLVEEAPQQTYASVLANSQPGILYAPSPVSHQHPSHSRHTLRFNSEGSSLFSPSGRHLHLVYSQPPRAPYSQQPTRNHHISLSNEGLEAQIPVTHQKQIQLSAAANNPQQSESRDESQQTAARYEATSSTTPSTTTASVHNQLRGHQKYRNEQTRGALTLRSGRTYGDHRVIASTPAPSDGGAASESVQTRRIVVNHPFQTVQEVVEQEPITKYHQVTVNEPAQANNEGLQQDQQKASYRHPPAAYKVAATYNHPVAAVSYHHGGSH